MFQQQYKYDERKLFNETCIYTCLACNQMQYNFELQNTQKENAPTTNYY